ncbi:cytochrome-c peroxidase [Kaarinaea lacus]
MFGTNQLTITLAVTFLAFFPVSSQGFDYLQPLPDTPLVPADNPLTEQKIALGQKLFYDTSLLGPKSTLSCNSCHNLAQGGDDNRATSIGQNGQSTRRSAPGLLNIGLQTVLYWDGRSTSLERQALDHLRDPLISTWPSIGSIVTHLGRSPDYRAAFEKAFPDDPIVSGKNLARALASFQRSLLSSDSPFDRYINGDKGAISESAKRGIQAFNDTGCLACHFGVNFAGPAPGPAMDMGDGFYELFPNNLGSPYDRQYQLTDDLGRYEFTGDPGERYMWRVPSLRNIELTAPYFHNGSVPTLEEAIRVMAKTQTDRILPEATVKDISAFLRSLTGKTPGNISASHSNDK